ncbi:Scr1 family TA system antitoxin-like transcriptional regulator [Streptomyces chrestomyceticus]|uniref:Scr1 family TA system antitoxin-like transcriptional regulator n=1 Tax=Streptomyces chrestomyceticus TaxID=68185 RepID=UPI0033D4F668
MLYAHGPVPQLDTVQLDPSHGPTLLDTEAQLAKYRTLLGRLHALALDPAASRNFIHAIARKL